MASMLSTVVGTSPSSTFVLIVCFFITNLHVSKCAKPEQGKWIVSDVSEEHPVHAFVRSMYKGTEISVLIECESSDSKTLKVEWLVRRSPCAQEYLPFKEKDDYIDQVLDRPFTKFLQAEDYLSTEYIRGETEFICDSKKAEYLPWVNSSNPTVVHFSTSTAGVNTTGSKSVTEKPVPEKGGSEQKKERSKRQSGDPPPAANIDEEKAKGTTAAVTSKPTPSTPSPTSSLIGETFMNVWEDGYYLFAMRIVGEKEFKLQLTVKTLWEEKYISAADWPLLIFYGVMGLVYIGLGIFWLVMLACNWRDLLRIQFWVGAVILLGMLEKAVFFAEYENISSDGVPVPGAIIFAELVSCVKRGLARMLVIIVSLGFGIVKPRLGQTLHKVVLAGTLFIVLASIEGCMRVIKSRAEQSNEEMYAAVPLAVTDAVICWWIFSSLLQTTRTLRLRRNVVKLSLYRHFTNTLIFAVIASVAYMIWFLTQHRFKECLKDWKELWVDEAFWHLLFSVILFIIMILWRPTANNQRYAFSPLLDAAEDDLDDDQVLSEAFDGMKMRSTKPQQRNGSPFEEKKLEDDLKWVEENIPSSISDKILPALDSDEEIMNTKFEVSKME